jgi:hypothetical protein
MYRKCLIALGTVVLCISTLYAHPNWGVTYNSQYEWAKKRTAGVPVYLKIEPWTRITPIGDLAIEQESDTPPSWYSDCIELELLANFRPVTVVAVVNEIVDLNSPWYVSLVEGTGSPNYQLGSTSVTIADLHTVTPAILTLCVRIYNPQWTNYDEDPVAEVVVTTYMNNVEPVGDPVYLYVGTPGD